MNRESAAWLHLNYDVAEEDLYPLATVMTDGQQGIDLVDTITTVLIVLAVIGLIVL